MTRTGDPDPGADMAGRARSEVDERIDALIADPAVRARLIERLHADLATTEEAGELLGVTPQRVHQLAKRPDFPRPVRQGARWSVRELGEFRARWSRDPGRRAGS